MITDRTGLHSVLLLLHTHINNNETEAFQVVVQHLPEYHPQLICTDPECDQSPSRDYSSSSSYRPLPTKRPNNNQIA